MMNSIPPAATCEWMIICGNSFSDSSRLMNRPTSSAQTTATAAASVTVTMPVRMPPSTTTGASIDLTGVGRNDPT